MAARAGEPDPTRQPEALPMTLPATATARRTDPASIARPTPTTGITSWRGAALLAPLRRLDARQTVRCLTPDVRTRDRVLDLGCGTGFVGALMEAELGCSVVGCDVVPMNVALDEFHLFDGENVPFPSYAFDVTVLAYVLHHVPNPLVLLREARRLTRRAVIVVEDTPRCWADRAWGHLHVHGFNGTYGLPHGRVRDDEEWRSLFAAAGLHLVRTHAMRRLERFPPNARTQYTLATGVR